MCNGGRHLPTVGSKIRLRLLLHSERHSEVGEARLRRPNVACRNTVQELPVRLTSYIPIPKTPRTEPGENDLHYCQRTTASGDCRLRPAGAERNRFGNAIFGWAGRSYVSMGERPIEFTTSSLGKWTFL